ncbi:MAG: hypothetical protein XU10_C0008G0076 [Chloroflexi bacterium CSP1-4]|nr:MAG: hypothetical protein XU10_C0008G0076 [Chloroflexi bacterium CSP1-4]
MSFDTRIRTSYPLGMPRVKRTYNLPEETVRAVRELSEQYGLAPTQDAVVELAVDELRRQLRYAEEEELWARAASDPEFIAEAEDLARAFAAADAETWPE